jgi:hypothetical protein
MSEFGVELRLDVGVEPDADVAELERAVDAVERLPGEPPPAGARASEATVLGGLVPGHGREAIGVVVRTIQAWVARRSSRTIKVTLGSGLIAVTNVSDDDQRRETEAFLARYALPSS